MEHVNGQPKKRSKKATAADAQAVVRANVRTVADLEAAAQKARSRTDRVVDAVSAFCGSLAFVYVHAIWFGVWIALNLSPLRRLRFDPYPFGLLTLVVSLEAIFLSTFILITQNRQALTADRRNHLDLQINLLSEQENTKMLQMLEAVHKKLGIAEEDPEVAALEEATRPEHVVEEIERHADATSEEKHPVG